MPTVRLTDRNVRTDAPKAGQLELWDDLVPGFGLRIAAGGSRTYFVMKRLNGRLVRRTVGKALGPGDLPSPARLGVSEARERARGMLAALAAGQDPGTVRRAKAAPDDEAGGYPRGTFGWIADRYLKDTLKGGGAKLKSKDELERKLKVDLKAWHKRPIGEIKGKEIRELVREKAQASPVSANRLLSFIKRVFRWAAVEGYIDADPAAAVEKPSEEAPRDRFLSEEEIRLFWKACDRLGDPAGRMFKLALVTLQRRGEVAGLRYSELGELEYKAKDPKTGRDVITKGAAWLLPAERTKRGVAHTVPLSPLAKDLIDGAVRLEVGGKLYDHVFPSGRRGDQPVTGWSRFKDRLDDAIGRVMAEEAGEEYDAKKHRLPDWHLHDLRATGATHLEMPRLGVSRTVISRILNHSEGDGRSMTARYIRHTWDREAADALEAWATELKRIIGANVVKMKDAAS